MATYSHVYQHTPILCHGFEWEKFTILTTLTSMPIEAHEFAVFLDIGDVVL